MVNSALVCTQIKNCQVISTTMLSVLVKVLTMFFRSSFVQDEATHLLNDDFFNAVSFSELSAHLEIGKQPQLKTLVYY